MDGMREKEKTDVEKTEAQEWREMTVGQLKRIANQTDLKCVYYFTKRMAELQ